MLTLRISVDRARVGRGRAWIEESGIVERGQDAWSWLRRDERGRIVGLIVASVATSIAVSLLATALVRMIEHRRATGAADVDDPAAAAEAHVEAEPATTEAPAAEQAAEPAEA
jgi:hypothetical protein